MPGHLTTARLILAISLCFFWFTGSCGPGECKEKSNPEVHFVSQSVLVRAPADLVFDCIRRSRHTDPRRRKVLSYDGTEAVIEEHFAGLPVLGSATCVYRECEVPLERIDYNLIRSSQFRAFEGHWELVPSRGDCTLLKLSSYIDPVIWVPFKEQISRGVTLKDIQRRLSAVKADAEGRKKDAI